MQETLTSREREIFDLLLEGVSPKEIAHKLHISYHTVDTHRSSLYSKLGIHSMQELFVKYSNGGNGNGAAVAADTGQLEPARIPSSVLLLYPNTDKDHNGGNSTSEVYITQETIDGLFIDDVINIKTTLVKSDVDVWAYAKSQNSYLLYQLRNAKGIKFKAKGDGKAWRLQLQTAETVPENNHSAYQYVFGTVRDKVVIVDIPYSSLTMTFWTEPHHRFDFNKETINSFIIGAFPDVQGFVSSSLQIFDFEVY